MPTDFGTDLSCGEDGLSPSFELVSGARCVAEAIYHRLSTQRGSLVDDAGYGLDVRAYLARPFTTTTAFALQSLIAAEVRRDERVQSVRARVSFDAGTHRLTIAVEGEAAEGPFALALSISDLSVELLSLS